MIWVEEIRRGLSNVRYYLLKIRDTKAYVALGYETFEAFGTAEFGYEKSHLYRLADAAEIELSLNSPIGEKPIPETHLRPLAPVPEEERQAILDEDLWPIFRSITANQYKLVDYFYRGATSLYLGF